MVNTDEIHAAQAAKDAADRAAKASKANADSQDSFDDVMLAMDVVDTLRHEQGLVDPSLSPEDRRLSLIERLRDIYSAQGIDVSDEVLMDGVAALEDERFAYKPPKPGLSTRLAKIYIGRRKWLPLFYTAAFIAGSATAINYFGFVRPGQIKTAQTEKLLSETLPEQLADSYSRVQKLAETPALKERAESIYLAGTQAAENRDVTKAEKAAKDLNVFADDLASDYALRIVSRPGEMSGVFRINDDSGTEVRNYYLIVEGITASGDKVSVSITSEEDQKTKRVSQWGLRVPIEVFNRVAADKRDDQIIQNAIIGRKTRGLLDPEYTIETSGGTILDWK